MSLGMVHGKQLVIGAAAGAADGVLQEERVRMGWPWWTPGAYEGALVVGSVALAASRVWPAAAPLFYGGLFALSERGGKLVARKAGIGGPGGSGMTFSPPVGATPYFPGMQARNLRPRITVQPAGVAA